MELNSIIETEKNYDVDASNVTNLQDFVVQSDYIILCIKPNGFKSLLENIKTIDGVISEVKKIKEIQPSAKPGETLPNHLDQSIKKDRARRLLEVSKELEKNYFNKYSKIKEFMDNIINSATDNGYVTTILNRRRYIPEIKSSNFMLRNAGKRAAMNAPIQGSAADIIKIAMINVYKKLQENNLKSKLILQVHDELIVEAIDSEIDLVKKIVRAYDNEKEE